MVITATVLSGFILALLTPLLFRLAPRWSPWVITLLPFGLLALVFDLAAKIPPGGEIVVSWRWVPALDASLSFLVDGLSLLFAALVTGIGGFVFLYSRDYLNGDRHMGRFYAFLLFFMGSMLGLVLADNVICLYIFWELTTISSFLLIGFHHDEAESRRAALQALLVTNAGGLALLAGLILLAQAGGSNDLSQLLARGDLVRAHPHYPAIVILILAGACTKSAQFPFHFWLPNAMAAPTPVSAYLHSATMVKGGVYLVARMIPVLGGTGLWISLLAIVGGATLVAGAAMALAQRDLKRLLAYSTVSVLGMLILMLGIGTDQAVKGAMVYLLAHALYKAGLFLCTGILDHGAGTRDVTRLGGLARAMPLTALAAVLAAVSKSGLPPAVGLIGKELIYEAGLHFQRAAGLLVLTLLFGNMLLAAVAWLAGIRPFFGPRPEMPGSPHEAPFSMWVGPLALGLAGIAGGLFPQGMENLLVKPAAAAAAGHQIHMDMALWHGFTPAVALSLLTVAGGLVLFFLRRPIRAFALRLDPLTRLGPDHLYELLLTGLGKTAAFMTRILQSGYQRYYLITVFTVTVLLILSRLPAGPGFSWPEGAPSAAHAYEFVLTAVMLLAALFAVLTRNRLAAVMGLSVIGFGITLIFVWYSGPDLAITQLLVETLSVILFVFIIYRLPHFARFSSRSSRIRDAFISLAVGAVMALLAFKAVAVQLHPAISHFFAAQGVSQAHGHNIVNLILVDFRVLDTLGEITVLAVAAVGVYALLNLIPSSEKD